MAVVVIAFMCFALPVVAFAAQDSFSLSGKEIIEKLARLEEGQKGLNKRIDDLRSELKGDIDDLKGELKGDIDDLRSLVYLVLGGIIALIAVVIWDRRTALSPVIRKTKELEERDDLTLRILKEYALKEPKLGEVLKSLGVL